MIAIFVASAVLLIYIFCRVYKRFRAVSVTEKDIVYIPVWQFYFGFGLYASGAVLWFFMLSKEIVLGCAWGVALLFLSVAIMADQCNTKITAVSEEVFLHTNLWGKQREYRYADVVAVKPIKGGKMVVMIDGTIDIGAFCIGAKRFWETMEAYARINELENEIRELEKKNK